MFGLVGGIPYTRILLVNLWGPRCRSFMQIIIETRLFELSIIFLGGISSPHSEEIITVVMLRDLKKKVTLKGTRLFWEIYVLNNWIGDSNVNNYSDIETRIWFYVHSTFMLKCGHMIHEVVSVISSFFSVLQFM
jgi:hypothetical protein